MRRVVAEMVWSLHVRPADEPELDLSMLPPPRSDLFPFRLPLLADSERACCCPAAPRVQVLLSGHDPQAVPLLLCMHHWRSHRDRLTVLGAAAYGRTGQRIGTGPH